MALWDNRCGEYFSTHEERLRLVHWRVDRIVAAVGVLIALALPLVFGQSTLLFISSIFITIIAVLGLNVIIGYTGLIILAQGAFMAIGAYTTVQFLHLGLVPALLIGGLVAGFISLLMGLPTYRVKGFYVAISTLALQFVSEWFFNNSDFEWLHGGSSQFYPREVGLIGEFAVVGRSEPTFYYLMLVLVVLAALVSWNLSRTGIGRLFRAIRDNDIAAEVLGINLFRNKLYAFTVGGFMIGVSGGLYGWYLRTITPDFFDITITIDHYVMLITGGLGYVWGAILGTGFISVLDDQLRNILFAMANLVGLSPSVAVYRPIVFGAIIILVLIVEPKGIVSLLQKLKQYLKSWPFEY